MKLGTNFFKSETPSHMTVRQVAMVVAALAACVALFVVDNGANSDVNSNTNSEVGIDGAIDITEVLAMAPMPHVAAADALTTNWFCPGVPANDDTISSNCGRCQLRRYWSTNN